MVDYADLMSQTDGAGVGRSFLATEETFKMMKDLEEQNLLVPVVGNFGGPKALRSRGQVPRATTAPSSRVLPLERRAVPEPGRHLGASSAPTSRPCRSTSTSTFIRSGRAGSAAGGGSAAAG